MVGSTAVALSTAPVVLGGLALADLVRGRRHLPRARVHLFVLQYLVNDTVEIFLVPLFRLRALLDGGVDAPASRARHRRLQLWSVELLARRAEQLLGMEVVLDDESRRALTPGPVIVISRHVSLFDAALPGLVLGREGLAVRGVILAELLADPGFDLLYGRLGSVFIPRDDGPAARAAVTAMAEEMSAVDRDRGAVVLFPEGRLYRPSVARRSLERLAERDPARARRLGGLSRVLPPRPTGFGLLVDALPSADVVLIDHRGLDRVARLGDLPGAVPVGPVAVSARRFRRADIPDDPDGVVRWLDERWLALDGALTQPSNSSLDGPDGAR
jgi:1-acyl-sn-glycerol-3-phosphate acyltransferase